MDVTTLQKANDLTNKIEKCNEALDCFQWPTDDVKHWTKNPILIIEHDAMLGGLTGVLIAKLIKK